MPPKEGENTEINVNPDVPEDVYFLAQGFDEEPKTREQELSNRADKSRRKIESAIASDEQADYVLEELRNGTGLAEIFLDENIQIHKSIADRDPNAAKNADIKNEIINASYYMKAFESENLDVWLDALKNDPEFCDFVNDLNVPKMKSIMKYSSGMNQAYHNFADAKQNPPSLIDIDINHIAGYPITDIEEYKNQMLEHEKAIQNELVYDLLFNEPKIKDTPQVPAITEQAGKIADREAREAAAAAAQKLEAYMTKRYDANRNLERATTFGKKTARYYQAILKNKADELDEYFPENGTNRNVKPLLAVLRKELADVLDAKTENRRQMAADDALSTLKRIPMLMDSMYSGRDKHIDEDLPDSGRDKLIDEDLLDRQYAYLDLLELAVKDAGNAPDDPEFGDNDELYHNMDDRIREVDARLAELTPEAGEDPKVVMLALLAKQSLLIIQDAVAKDADGGADHTYNASMNALRNKNDLAALYLYQLVNPYITFAKQEPLPDDSADRREQIEEQKKAADIVLTELRSKDLAKSIDQVKADKSFQTVNQALSIGLLNRIMMRPDGMLQAYREVEAERQRQAAISEQKKADRLKKYEAIREKLIKEAAESERKNEEKLDKFESREREIDEKEFEEHGFNEKQREEMRRKRAELQQERRGKHEREQREHNESRLNEKLRKVDESMFDELGLNEEQRKEMRSKLAAHEQKLREKIRREFTERQRKKYESDKKTTEKERDVRKHDPSAGLGKK